MSEPAPPMETRNLTRDQTLTYILLQKLRINTVLGDFFFSLVSSLTYFTLGNIVRVDNWAESL